MKEFQVKTPRTPEGAERRASDTFEWAIKKYSEEITLDGEQIIGNTINDKENGVKISLVPLTEVAYVDEKGRGWCDTAENLAILNVKEYSNSKKQKSDIATAETTFLFDDKGNICEFCYSDERKFADNQEYEVVYDDCRNDDQSLSSVFYTLNAPINASFLDSLAMSTNFDQWDPTAITNDIEQYAMPTCFKAYLHQRLDLYTDSQEIADSCDGLPLDDLKLVVDKVAELDDEELQSLADEYEDER